jgi:hypothetical protein
MRDTPDKRNDQRASSTGWESASMKMPSPAAAHRRLLRLRGLKTTVTDFSLIIFLLTGGTIGCPQGFLPGPEGPLLNNSIHVFKPDPAVISRLIFSFQF